MEEHFLCKEGASGSNPLSSTIEVITMLTKCELKFTHFEWSTTPSLPSRFVSGGYCLEKQH